MPDNSKRSTPKEFLIVSLPDKSEAGATLRLLAVKKSQSEAERAIVKLDSSILGRVAVLERKALYVRQPAVESSASEEAITKN